MPNWRSESSLPSLSVVRVYCEHMFVSQARPVPDISDVDLHWLAGLLEGEGSFLAGPPSAPRSPAIQFWMTDRDVVERAAAMLDSAVMPGAPRRAHWKTTYAVRLRGPRAVVLTMLAAGGSIKEVAERFRTSIWTMYDLRGGRSYRHLPRMG
jgi:hypothetical protein